MVTQKMRDDFEEFLVEMDFLLEDLGALLSATRRWSGQLVAFDDGSLDEIEAFYLTVLSDKERVAVSQARLDRIIIAFYGEALRERRDAGEWRLCDAKGDPALGTPVVADWAPGAEFFAPVVAREFQKEDRKPFLRELVDYAVNLENVEEDFFKDL